MISENLGDLQLLKVPSKNIQMRLVKKFAFNSKYIEKVKKGEKGKKMSNFQPQSCPPCRVTMLSKIVTMALAIGLLVLGYLYYKKSHAPNSPPSTEELGRSGWTVLHSFATSYPENPSNKDLGRLSDFLEYFAHYYPCEKCSYHMTKYLSEHPLKASTRSEFQNWLCGFHNDVNKRLNKTTFDCSTVGARWSNQPVCSDTCKMKK